MTPNESAELVAARLPKALAKASGVKWWTLDAIQRATFAAESMALLYELTQAGLTVLPNEVFSNEKTVPVESQARAGLRILQPSGETGASLDPATNDQGVCTSRTRTQERAVPEA